MQQRAAARGEASPPALALPTLAAGALCAEDGPREAFDGLRSSVKWAGVPLSGWEAVPLSNVACTAHYNGPRYDAELEARTPRRFRVVGGSALLASLGIYIAVGALPCPGPGPAPAPRTATSRAASAPAPVELSS